MKRFAHISLVPAVLAISLLGLTACTPSSDTSSSSSTASDDMAASIDDSAVTSFESASASSSSAEAASSSSVAMTDFPHNPAGQLDTDTGSGYTDLSNWAPGICFPLAQTPDYADSQV